VDFGHENKVGGNTCPVCYGAGVVYDDCDTCLGIGCDDEGEPCGVCEGIGNVEADCLTCDGTGKLADMDEAPA
jgi:RecJ-like exonuclease